MKVFWSWQSDTASRSGRRFVQKILEEICKEIAQTELDPASRPELDHDTQNVPGSPEIATTILAKIAEASVFVADVSPVAATLGGKTAPNANVMFELGYAKAKLSSASIILVMNADEGAGEKLPFDLRHWRWPIRYSLNDADTSDHRASVRLKLKSDLKRALSMALGHVRGMPKAQPVPAPALQIELPPSLLRFEALNEHSPPPVERVIAENPKWPTEFVSGAPNIWGLSASQIGALRRATPLEFIEYNKDLDRYIGQYQDYLAAFDLWAKNRQRTLALGITLYNHGVTAATNVRVKLQFPSGVELYAANHPPKAPVEPVKPYRPGQVGRKLPPARPSFDDFVFNSARHRVDRGRGTVEFRLDRLQQYDKAELDQICFLVLSPPPIAASYQLICDEVAGAVVGDLALG